jgi:hypothetical protein
VDCDPIHRWSSLAGSCPRSGEYPVGRRR